MRCEKKSKTMGINRRCGPIRVQIDRDTKSLQNIGAAAATGNRPVTVLADAEASRSKDQGIASGDVKCFGSVTTGSTDVDQILTLRMKGDRMRAQGACATDDLVHGFTLACECSQKSCCFLDADSALHDEGGGRLGFLPREILGFEELL